MTDSHLTAHSLSLTGDMSTQGFKEQDIVGLSVIEASPQYILKFNTLRQHLNKSDHPLVKIIIQFRDILLQYIKEA